MVFCYTNASFASAPHISRRPQKRLAQEEHPKRAAPSTRIDTNWCFKILLQQQSSEAALRVAQNHIEAELAATRENETPHILSTATLYRTKLLCMRHLAKMRLAS